jgi:leucyl-tRNA synthetase
MKDDEYFVMSDRAAKNMAYQELVPEHGKIEKVADVSGDDLVGLPLKAPMTSYEKVYALPMSTISMKKGTGIVTSVPSDSPDDFATLRDLQTKEGLREKLNVKEEWVKGFEPVAIIDVPEYSTLSAIKACEDFKVASHKDADNLKKAKEHVYLKGFYNGIMMQGPTKGQKVQDAKPIVKKMMLDEGLAIPYYETESEVISRTGDECIVSLCYQWMLVYGEEEWKELVKKHVVSENFKTYNPKTLHEFEVILDWLKEWGCSRTMGLGTKLPWDDSFVIESLSDSTIYMSYYTIAHLLQGGCLNGTEPSPLGIKPEDLTDAAWDYVFKHTAYPDGCNIQEETLAKLRHEFEYWYPMNMRVSAKDLIRNHLTMSLYNHAAIWEDGSKMAGSYFCNGYLMLNSDKMSKSTGNFLTIKQCI